MKRTTVPRTDILITTVNEMVAGNIPGDREPSPVSFLFPQRQGVLCLLSSSSAFTLGMPNNGVGGERMYPHCSYKGGEG